MKTIQGLVGALKHFHARRTCANILLVGFLWVAVPVCAVDGYWTGGGGEGPATSWWNVGNWFGGTPASGQNAHAHFGEFIASGSHTFASGSFGSLTPSYSVEISASKPGSGPSAVHLHVGELYFNDANATASTPKVWTILSNDPTYGIALHGGGGGVVFQDVHVIPSYQTVDLTARLLDTNTGGGNPTSLAKKGAGTFILSNTSNSFTGGIRVDEGTLALGTSGVIPDVNNLTLNGGTFATQGFDDTLGTLTLTANSVIDMGNGASILNFAASNLAVWTPGTTLSIWNWSGNPGVGGGTDQIYVGNSLSGLTVAQLNQISFYSGAGTGFLGTAIILADGEIVPVPEPGALMSTLLLLTVVGWRERGFVLRRRQAVA